MELINAREIRLARKDEQIVAVLGFDLKSDCKAAGATVQEALRNLASEIDRREISVWVPAAAKQYVEDGVLKAACPECGASVQHSRGRWLKNEFRQKYARARRPRLKESLPPKGYFLTSTRARTMESCRTERELCEQYARVARARVMGSFITAKYARALFPRQVRARHGVLPFRGRRGAAR